MKIKKIAAIILTAAMLFTLAACGKGGNMETIPVSKLEFGMTREQVNSLIEAEPYMTEEGYDIYLDIPSDFDERLNNYVFEYNGAERLEILTIRNDYTNESEAAALREDIMGKINDLYGLSDDSWEFDDTENAYYNIDITQKIAINTRVNSNEDGFATFLTIGSYEHGKDEHAENIPIIPKK